MNVKLRVLSAGVLFFIGHGALAQKVKKDTASTKDIDEVVVVGYVKKSVAQLTGSSTTLKVSDIDTPSAISVDQALQGKVPGVVVNTSSGSPGAFQDIRIRGVGSFTASNAPLFVIDGVPVVNGNNAAITNVTTLSALASLSNDDIESITVLKDAASTAVYGARGSNGVIVITTKRGKKGKTEFDLSTTVGFQNEAYNKMNMLSGKQRLELLTEAVANSLNLSKDLAFERIKSNNIGRYNLWDGKEYNWKDLLTRKNAGLYVVNLSAKGGDDKSTFYTSLGYNKTEPISIGDPFERITGAFSYTRKLTDKVNFETSINGSWLKQNPLLEGGSFFSNPYLTRVLLTPWARPYNADGSYNIDNFSQMTSIANTLYTQKNNILWNKQMRGMVNTKVDYKILKTLTYTTRLNIDYMFNDYKSYDNRNHGDGRNNNGSADRRNTQNFNWASINQLNFVERFGDHRLDVSAFFEYQKNQRDFLRAAGQNFPTDGLTNLDNASANYRVESNYSDWKNASYFGVLNYSFANKYILDATIRREGSSRFSPNKRFGTFWSFGAGWNIHKENFVPKFFNELKLRTSYGLTGNSGVGINAYQATLSYNVAYDGNGGSYVTNFGNPNLTWEKNKTFDAGIDFSIWNARISGSVDYYNRKTFDLLQDVPLSRTTGFTKQAQNVGSMRNSGIEASLNVQIINSKNFNWSVFGSVATVKNTILKLAPSVNGLPIDVYAGSEYRKAVEGMPFQGWFMRTWAGVNTQTGAPEWYVNGVDGEKTSDYNKAQRVFQGTAIPKYTGGFGTNLSYKNISLNASFYYSGGHKIYEQFAQFYYRTNSFTLATYNGSEDLMGRWQKPGDVTDIPKLALNGQDNFDAVSSRYLYKGDFIRLKDITLGYSLPRDFVNSIGVTGLKLTVRGTNLWTYTFDRNLKFDPEVDINGYSNLTTPPVKSVMFGVNVQF
ncbi:SusC/RagA family TonB-linked outer membrane protein [Elizabethkingia sp. HX WHF]|uniref:SusC/RagA family TonB-linked outer membrane protein n=1 Tax=Elizabethkingia TaxID=308865 RepID=UPI00099A3F0C|nr:MULTISPECIES: SusC/RagA family TonB-linked outer membrane protein [Elizabethkingia]ATL44252.1 SusC/RagA family TonB-linked outer membrane protein [Elizabethkingia miricola]MCL1639729.1 SusC/RagA family TonB-linked outer membrane protein [Elizabethkingia bruuniana]MDX8565812.1 SusC/RagA family TonB-linked outer membrane protein [Elizabethkingia sp. HX WHF]OPC27548.1 SusC/RagA family TonB-linked outer membrane protein [Elizabethkingia bruuniana]OPC52477.1 SusC/RagA family TonB-linked outer me